ncbi:hypothetical protein JA1_003606 [Spathaspora sp. JA1]|nr:hypothetical protein JA1_003606 [Spathaspora sp. JA1]
MHTKLSGYAWMGGKLYIGTVLGGVLQMKHREEQGKYSERLNIEHQYLTSMASVRIGKREYLISGDVMGNVSILTSESNRLTDPKLIVAFNIGDPISVIKSIPHSAGNILEKMVVIGTSSGGIFLLSRVNDLVRSGEEGGLAGCIEELKSGPSSTLSEWKAIFDNTSIKTKKSFSDPFDIDISMNLNQVKFKDINIYVDCKDVLGTFELKDSIALKLATSSVLSIDALDTARYLPQYKERAGQMLVSMAHVKMFTQLVSTFAVSDTVRFTGFAVLKRMSSYLPLQLDAVLSGFGNFRTKYGKFKVRWPKTTAKTALINALLYYYKCVGSPPGYIDTNNEVYSKLIFQDREGYEKLQEYCKRFLSKFPSLRINDATNEIFHSFPLDKLFPVTANTSVPNWFMLDNDGCDSTQYLDIYRLYLMTQEQFLTVEAFTPKQLNALEVLGLNYSAITDDSVCDDIHKIIVTYETRYSGNLKSMFDLTDGTTPGSGQGYLGQLYEDGPNEFSSRSYFPSADSDRIFGHVISPSISVEYDPKYILRSSTHKSELVFEASAPELRF